MGNQLQFTLVQQLNSDWQYNPAVRTLVHDYIKYHTVFLVAGGVMLLLSALLAAYLWVRFRRVASIRRLKWPFEKKVYFMFGSVLTTFSLFFLLIWAANLSTVLNPLPGFSSLASSTSVPSDSTTGRAITGWVASGSAEVPLVLKEKIQERINWQRPKAVICGLLLILFTALTVGLWGSLIKKSRTDKLVWSYGDRALMIIGGVLFVLCLLLSIMTVANAQGAIGPIVMSLLGVGG